MQINPYEDEGSLEWIPQENQSYERESDKIRNSQMSAPLQYEGRQQNVQGIRSQPADRMSKAQALDLVDVYKKRLIVATLVVFGLVSGLVAFHQVGVSANQAPVDPSQPVPVTQPAQPPDDGGFFNQNQQGGNNFGSGGFWQQQPSSGTGVS